MIDRLRTMSPWAVAATALIALGVAGGALWLLLTYWEWAVALAVVVGGYVIAPLFGERGRRARWKRDHGRFLTDEDHNSLAAQAALDAVKRAIVGHGAPRDTP